MTVTSLSHIPHHPQPPPWSPAFRQVPSRPQPSPAIPSQVAASPSFCPQNEEKWLYRAVRRKKFAACTFQHVVFFEIYTAGLAARHTRRWRPHAFLATTISNLRLWATLDFLHFQPHPLRDLSLPSRSVTGPEAWSPGSPSVPIRPQPSPAVPSHPQPSPAMPRVPVVPISTVRNAWDDQTSF